MDDRGTVIVMETLFDIRRAVHDIHEAAFPPADEDDDASEEDEEDEP